MTKIAQQILVVDPETDEEVRALPVGGDVVVYEEEPTEEQVMALHGDEDADVVIEIESGSKSDEPGETELVEMGEQEEPFTIEISDIPGAPAGTPDPQPPAKSVEKDEEKVDEQGAKDKKTPKDKWDWAVSHGVGSFFQWVQERINDVPKHSGYDIAGLERAQSYLERLKKEIRTAMRNDLDGAIDFDNVSQVCKTLDEHVDNITRRIKKVEETSEKNKKAAGTSTQYAIRKQAAKSTVVDGIVTVVPLLITAIARICISASITSGHDLAVVFRDQSAKYKLTDREKLELFQLLSDMGYPLPNYDRGEGPEGKVDAVNPQCDATDTYSTFPYRVK
jgi:hypothetical protein